MPTSVTWTDPYSSANYCASCSIVVLSTGFGSFDSDEIPNSGTIPNLGESVAAATTRLGGIENGLGGKVLGSDIIGYYGLTPTQTGSSDVTYNSATGLTAGTSTCSAKSVMDFSLVRGVCPQQPNFEGSYYLAGLAFDAWTHDLRPDLTLYPGTRHVKTFAVSLAETLPTLNVPGGQRQYRDLAALRGTTAIKLPPPLKVPVMPLCRIPPRERPTIVLMASVLAQSTMH